MSFSAHKENLQKEVDVMYPDGIYVDPYDIKAVFEFFHPEYAQGASIKELIHGSKCNFR